MVAATGTGTLRTMGQRGDVKLSWDRADKASVEKARGEFAALVAGRRFSAFARGQGETTERRIDTFDPELAQKLWLEHGERELLEVANVWDLRGHRRQVHSGTGRQLAA